MHKQSRDLVHVEEALALVQETPVQRKVERFVLGPALLGRKLASDVYAPCSLPAFRQSSMDGYAINTGATSTYKVVGEVAAGTNIEFVLQPGECVRIFTGARVPTDADAVVIQELVERNGSTIEVKGSVKEGQNIRQIGSQIQSGQLVLSEGDSIQPAGLGLLRGLGIQNVEVFAIPSVSIIINGNELARPDQILEEGQVYESNSLVLTAALKQLGTENVNILHCPDEKQAIDEAIEKALASDVVLISGGISVGDYDFVSQSLEDLGVEQVFYKVRQKPGKPLFFGTKGTTMVFALPGNPASTLSCFYLYAAPLLHRILGLSDNEDQCISLPLTHAVENRFDRALILKAHADHLGVTINDEQNSATLLSFAKANALAYIPEHWSAVEKGTLVKTWRISN